MSAETIFFLLKIAGTIILLVLSALSVFLIIMINSVEKLKELTVVLKTMIDERNNVCNYKHTEINTKLNNLDKTSQNHEIRLVGIESKLNLD